LVQPALLLIESHLANQNRLGQWNWTLSNDLSQVPIPGLPTYSHSGTFYTCLPAIPLSPTLQTPIKFETIIGTDLTFSWEDPRDLEDSCTAFVLQGLVQERYKYSLLTSKAPSFDPHNHLGTLTSFRSGSPGFELPISGFQEGFHYWKVRLEKELVISGSVVSTLEKETRANVFSICVNKAPNAPVLLSPANDTSFPRCNITTNFVWEEMSAAGFGEDCTGSTLGIRVHLGTDMANLDEKTLEILFTQAESGPQSLIGGMLPNTRYYWQVEAYNSHSSNFSEVFSFITPDTSLTACSGNGECVAGGTCRCNYGWSGTWCEDPIPTESPSPSSGPSQLQAFPVGAVAGGVTGGLLALLVLALVAFVFLRKRVTNGLKKPERNPPDFEPLAFTPPPGYPPLPQEKIVPWYSFEQLLVSNNFAFSYAILDITQSTEIEEICKSLVYIAASRGQATELIKALISKDLREKKESNNLNSNTLFRDNSHASKAFKHFAKIVALPYLFYIFGDLVYEMCESFGNNSEPPEDTRKKSSKSFISDVVVQRFSDRNKSSLLDRGNVEMDPRRMQDEDDDLSNALYLQLRCQKLLVQILRSAQIFPPSFSEVANHLMNEVQEYLGRDDGYRAVAGFLFLRLINPSILFPHYYGLVDSAPDDESLTRQLILITKVMQNLVFSFLFFSIPFFFSFSFKQEFKLKPSTGQWRPFRKQRRAHDRLKQLYRLQLCPFERFLGSNHHRSRESISKFLSSLFSFPPVNSARNEPTEQLIEQTAPAKGTISALSLDPLTEKRGPKKADDPDFFDPQPVPRSVVETSLIVLYNQFQRNRDRVFTALEKYHADDNLKIAINKSNAISSEIGEPIARNLY